MTIGHKNITALKKVYAKHSALMPARLFHAFLAFFVCSSKLTVLRINKELYLRWDISGIIVETIHTNMVSVEYQAIPQVGPPEAYCMISRDFVFLIVWIMQSIQVRFVTDSGGPSRHYLCHFVRPEEILVLEMCSLRSNV